MFNRHTPLGALLVALSFTVTPAGATEASTPLLEALHEALAERGFEGPALRRHIDRVQTFPEACLDGGALRAIDLLEVGPDGGTLTAQAQIASGAAQTRCWVRARVRIDVPTVVARRAVPRGEVLSAQDLEIQWLARTRQTLTEPGHAIGRRVKRALRPQEAVVANLLDLPRVIARGDQVRVSLRRGGVHLRTDGEALMSGAVGAQISVRLQTTRRVVQATVLNTGHVEVQP